jgi:quercetin 2,3-dioxygenase
MYNPLSVLRVLNDDTVDAGKGFDTYPHSNMEIISIPHEGNLEHKDSLGNVSIIKKGDVQIMSSGTGILHNEYTNSKERQVKFLQIWISPDKRDVPSSNDQMTLKTGDRHNKLQQIISPVKDDEILLMGALKY